VSELDQLRQRVKELEQDVVDYRALLENAYDAVVRFDKNLRSLYISSPSSRCVLFNPEAMIGKEPGELGFTGEYVQHLKTVFETSQPQRSEAGLNSNKGIFQLECYLSPELDGSGKVTTVTSYLRNLTDRKLTQEVLLESEERYRSFVQNFHGIAFRGRMADFTPIFFHGAVEAITGYTEDELTAGRPRWDQIIHPEDLSLFASKEEKKLHAIVNYKYEREYRIIRKDGQIRWVHEIIQSVCCNSIAPNVVQGTIYDITESKQIKKEREHLISELQEALATIRTLQGIIPICSSCKKIRNEKGNWEQLEAYIRENSNAEFSHSLCPDCARSLYPGYFKEEK
jgi:PAS domain S-box-containing protein